MTDAIKDVHTEHCCAQHGCKYADSDCPVASGNKPQSYPCESCEWEKEEAARHTAAKDAEIQALRAERQAFFDQACKQVDQRRSAESRAERLAEALQRALEAARDTLQQSYQNAGQECCGRGGMQECCGEPEPVWAPEDQAVMDKLAPIERMLSSALRDHDKEGKDG